MNDYLESEAIAHRQDEIRGVLYPDRGTCGLRMVGRAGETIAEVWISEANIDEVVGWLQFAKGAIEGRSE